MYMVAFATLLLALLPSTTNAYSAPTINFSLRPARWCDYFTGGEACTHIGGMVRVASDDPNTYIVAIYIFNGDRWWEKPYTDKPKTTIQVDGSFYNLYASHKQDPNHATIAAFVVKSSVSDTDLLTGANSGGGCGLPAAILDPTLTVASTYYHRGPTLGGYRWAEKHFVVILQPIYLFG